MHFPSAFCLTVTVLLCVSIAPCSLSSTNTSAPACRHQGVGGEIKVFSHHTPISPCKLLWVVMRSKVKVEDPYIQMFQYTNVSCMTELYSVWLCLNLNFLSLFTKGKIWKNTQDYTISLAFVQNHHHQQRLCPVVLHGNEWVTFHSTTDLHPSGHFSYCGQWVMLCFFFMSCYVTLMLSQNYGFYIVGILNY